MKNSTRVRLISDACGDTPKSLIGRYGNIISRNKQHDESGFKAYNVLFDGYANTKVQWRDELRAV